MPHAIYLHSTLTKSRTPCRDAQERGRLLNRAARRLVVLTSKASIMGGHVNRRHTVIGAIACVAVIIALNVLILFQQFAAT
jgi:Mn2+/Fe2+ NRAMP family transporter